MNITSNLSFLGALPKVPAIKKQLITGFTPLYGSKNMGDYFEVVSKDAVEAVNKTIKSADKQLPVSSNTEGVISHLSGYRGRF